MSRAAGRGAPGEAGWGSRPRTALVLRHDSAIGLGKEGRTREATARRKEATRGFGTMAAGWLRQRWVKAWNEASIPEEE